MKDYAFTYKYLSAMPGYERKNFPDVHFRPLLCKKLSDRYSILLSAENGLIFLYDTRTSRMIATLYASGEICLHYAAVDDIKSVNEWLKPHRLGVEYDVVTVEYNGVNYFASPEVGVRGCYQISPSRMKIIETLDNAIRGVVNTLDLESIVSAQDSNINCKKCERFSALHALSHFTRGDAGSNLISKLTLFVDIPRGTLTTSPEAAKDRIIKVLFRVMLPQTLGFHPWTLQDEDVDLISSALRRGEKIVRYAAERMDGDGG